METEILIARLSSLRLDLEALRRSLKLAWAFGLRTAGSDRGHWTLTERKLREAITYTEREIRKLEKNA